MTISSEPQAERLVRMTTTVRADEAPLLDGLAQACETSRAGILRSAVRYALDHEADFLAFVGPHPDAVERPDVAEHRLTYEVRLATLDMHRDQVLYRAACAAYDGHDRVQPWPSLEAQAYGAAVVAAAAQHVAPGPQPLQFDEPEYDVYGEAVISAKAYAALVLVLAVAITGLFILIGMFA